MSKFPIDAIGNLLRAFIGGPLSFQIISAENIGKLEKNSICPEFSVLSSNHSYLDFNTLYSKW
jgi:hypothetical protein